MKYRRIRYMFVSLMCAFVLVAMPLPATAEGGVTQASGVIITEVQTGAGADNEEFVELYNTSPDAIDITGWQVRFAPAGSSPDATVLLAEITASGTNRIILAGQAYFVLRAPSIPLPPGVANQTYTPRLDKNDKTIGLFARNDTQCDMVVQDAVAWASGPGTTLGEGPAVAVAQSITHILLQRHFEAEGIYTDTDSNAHDFSLAAATPGAHNPSSALSGEEPGPGGPSPLVSFPAANCGGVGNPGPNEGLDPLVITELLPNPDAPLSEPGDEFIELYNPNDQAFELSGYALEVGITTKTRYTFTEGNIEPHAYKAFYFSQTNTRLVNSNGQVRLFDPSQALLAETVVYASAGGNKVWALIDDVWQWSDTPTPDAANIGDDTDPGPPPARSANDGLAPPHITELLPAPGSGQLEFIELYNPNDVGYDLGGYVLETGTSTKYRFAFSSGTVLPAKTYGAFYADQTKLTLANKTGQARLIDPTGTVIAETLPYSDAKENQAWIIVDGSWQWTSLPTPNTANTLVVPQPPAKKTAAAKKKQSAAPKNIKSKTDKNSDKEDGALIATTQPNDPLHPGVLAVVAGFAVLYGAYEYRHDLAVRIQKWRANRATRGVVGAGPEGG